MISLRREIAILISTLERMGCDATSTTSTDDNTEEVGFRRSKSMSLKATRVKAWNVLELIVSGPGLGHDGACAGQYRGGVENKQETEAQRRSPSPSQSPEFRPRTASPEFFHHTRKRSSTFSERLTPPTRRDFPSFRARQRSGSLEKKRPTQFLSLLVMQPNAASSFDIDILPTENADAPPPTERESLSKMVDAGKDEDDEEDGRQLSLQSVTESETAAGKAGHEERKESRFDSYDDFDGGSEEDEEEGEREESRASPGGGEAAKIQQAPLQQNEKGSILNLGRLMTAAWLTDL
jgi:hypothetical protein